MTDRKILGRTSARREDIGNLVTRYPPPALSGPSPFLLIAHHGPQVFPPNNAGLPFSPHPHRGFETVTFIRCGQLLHEDSRSGPRVVHEGGVQWMTAGSGVVHNEAAPAEFRRTGGSLELLQLWLNLPSRLKDVPPKYDGVEAEEITAISHDDGRVTVNLVAGSFGGRTGPIRSLTDATLLSADFKAGGSVALPALRGRDVFLYVVDGVISVGGETVERHTRVELDRTGDQVAVSAPEDATIIFGCADLIEEPVAAHGPFVMTTPDELVQAVRDYQLGRFG